MMEQKFSRINVLNDHISYFLERTFAPNLVLLLKGNTLNKCSSRLSHGTKTKTSFQYNKIHFYKNFMVLTRK